MIELLQAAEGLPPGNYGHFSPDDEARLICAGLARVTNGPVPALSHRQIVDFNSMRHALPDGRFEQFEPVDRVFMTASGRAWTGPGKLYAFACTVAAGTMTVYDNTAASGRVVVKTFTLTVARQQVGTLFEPLTLGCYVVLSNPAARVFLVVG